MVMAGIRQTLIKVLILCIFILDNIKAQPEETEERTRLKTIFDLLFNVGNQFYSGTKGKN